LILIFFGLFMRKKMHAKTLDFTHYYFSDVFPSVFFRSIITRRFLSTCFLTALFSILFNYCMRQGAVRKYSYKTMSHTYGWITTFSFVHGVAAYLGVIFILSINIFTFVIFIEKLDVANYTVRVKDDGGNNNINNNPNNKEKNGMEDKKCLSAVHSGNAGLASMEVTNSFENPSKPSEGTDFSAETFPKNNKFVVTINMNSPWWTRCCTVSKAWIVYRIAQCVYCIKSTFSNIVKIWSNRSFICLNILQLINLVVVTLVNVLYVQLITSKNSDVSGQDRVYLPILLTIFKMIWGFYVSSMISYGIKAELPADLMFRYYLFSLIYMNILVPIGVVYFTSVNCFYYTLAPIPHVTESYSNFYSQQNCGIVQVQLPDGFVGLPFECLFTTLSVETTSKITPNWIYSYSCVSSLFITYIPALLSNYTVSGVIMPLLQTILLSFHRTSRVRNNFIVKKILPYTFNSLPEDTILDKEERQNRTYEYLSKMAVDILMLFTFGIASGFLTYLIIFVR